jgi:CzcA family heavy metal efflux pump
MMRSIVAWSMQLRLLMVAVSAVLIFFGVTELRNVPLDVVPEFASPVVEVQTEALGLSAAEVEAMITVPLEADMLNGAPFMKEIRSESIPGLSSIRIHFEPGTDPLTARQMVQERLTEVFALPNVSKPPTMLQPVSSSGRVLKVGMTSKTRSLIEMSVLARWTIVPRLMGVPGVSNVSIWGKRERQLQVQVDPKRLQAAGVTLDQVIETAGNALWASPLTFLNASTPGTGGWIETPNQRLGVRHLLPITTAQELAAVTVSGTGLRLGDVTDVVEDHQPLIGDAVVEDSPALMLVVEKLPEANTITVTRDVEKALESLRLGLPGIELDSSLYRPATYLELAGGNLSTALWVGAALALAALLGLLFSWRAALISTLAVSLSALAAVAVLYVQGVPINMMIVAGLMVALAALIDDGIVDVQNVARRLREKGEDGRSTALLVFDAIVETRGPLVYATAVALLAIVPALFLEGVWGAFGQAIALAYVLALAASLLVALTITPALSLLLLGDAQGEGRGFPLPEALRRACDGLLAGTGRAASRAVLGAVGALGLVVLLGFTAFPLSGRELIPQFHEREVLIDLDGPPGTSEAEMSRITTRASRELRSIAGVKNVSAHLGRAIMSDKVTDVEAGELWVSIDPKADYEGTLAAVREAMTGYPGFDIDVQTYLSEQIREEMGNDEDLVVRVYGDDLDQLRAKAEEVKRLVTRVDGVTNPRIELPDQQPNLEIEVDLEAAQRFGVKPGDVRRAAAALLSGIEVGSLFEEQKVFEVVVWGRPELRHSLNAVENLLIDAPGGSLLRLKDVAKLHIAGAPKVINREAVARHIDVEAAVRGRDLGAVAAEVESRLRQEVTFPLEFRGEVLGEHAARLAARKRVQALALAGALGIVLLLQAAFRSWGLAVFFFLTLPISLLGGVGALLLAGAPLSLGAVLGFLALFGIAARHGTALIGHFQQLGKQEGGRVTTELVRRGTRDRFVPIVMTAVVTGLAFLPFALAGNTAGHEILHSMARVVLGGLVTTTLVALLVVPSLYLRFGASAEPEIIAEAEPPRLIA